MYCKKHNLYCSENRLDYSWNTDCQTQNERPILKHIVSLFVVDYYPYKDKFNLLITTKF